MKKTQKMVHSRQLREREVASAYAHSHAHAHAHSHDATSAGSIAACSASTMGSARFALAPHTPSVHHLYIAIVDFGGLGRVSREVNNLMSSAAIAEDAAIAPMERRRGASLGPLPAGVRSRRRRRRRAVGLLGEVDNIDWCQRVSSRSASVAAGHLHKDELVQVSICHCKREFGGQVANV
jgi:hypothetical protein